MSYYPNVYASQTGPLLLSGLDANFNFAVDIQSQSLYAAAGGSADIITATFTPAVTSLVSGLTLYVRAATANTTTTPTFSPNSLTAKTIVKGNNQALVAGDIAGAGHILILQYDATNGVWELANPQNAAGSFTNLAYTGTLTGGTGIVNLGSGQFYKDSSGNVGIGTSSPSATLHVVGSELLTSSSAETKFIIDNTGTGGVQYWIGSTNNSSGAVGGGKLAFYDQTNNAARMVIDSSGNVGIGTTAPSAVLGVNGDIKFGSNSSGTYPGGRFYTNSGTVFIEQLNTQSMQFKTNSAEFIWNQGANERMRIDTSGNVGIGTTSPSSKLTISGSGVAIQATGAGETRIYTTNSTASVTTQTGAETSTGYIGTATNHPFVIRVNDSEKMRIDSSGNVGIGTSSPSANFKLTIAGGSMLMNAGNGATSYTGYRSNNQTMPTSDDGTTATLAFAFGGNYSSGSSEMTIWNTVNTGDGFYFYQKTGAAAATNIMKIQSTGNLTISGGTATKSTGTAWANPSDQRLKDNITDYTKGLPELLQVRVCTWDYNGKGGTSVGTRGLGVIADEVMQVLPSTVDTYKAKLNETDAQETDIKRFDATEITWLLVKSIQEQQALITSLTARITALESN